MTKSVLFIMTAFLLSVSAITSLAQNEICSLQTILSSFKVTTTSGGVDAWVEQYNNSRCERSVINGIRTIAAGYHQLSSSPSGTAGNPCSQAGIIASFEAAALSGEAEIWSQNYGSSNCPNEVKRAVRTLSQGYLQLTGGGSRIAFISNREGNYEIYTMYSDGTDLQRLTRNTAYDGRPDWSPDGGQIAFSSDRDGRSEIYIMNSDGSSQRRLTNNSSYDEFPAWSPDGSMIAFNSDRDGDQEIFLMNTDGSNQRQLTFNTSYDYWPSWSPDGTKILYASGSGMRRDIYVMDADGSNPRQLTTDPADDVDAAFSPDGQTIAFISNRGGTYTLYFMNADGSGEHIGSLNAGEKFHPDWSTAGTQLLIMINPNRPVSRSGSFNNFDDGGWELYTMDADGNNLVRITDNRFDEGDADWSP